MNDKFKQHDSFRFSTESENNRVDAAKQRLISEIENKVASALRTTFGNGKLVGSSESFDLAYSGEGPVSDSYVFNGKVLVNAELDNGTSFSKIKVEATVSDNEIAIPSEETLKEQVKASSTEHKELPIEEAKVLEADLGKFVVSDNGTDYLSVSHPSLWGTAVGVVSKNEYNDTKNKEALLKTMFNDRITNSAEDSYWILRFTGSFVAPVITKVAQEEFVEESVDKEAKKCEVCEDELSEKDPGRLYDPTCFGYLCEKHSKSSNQNLIEEFTPPESVSMDDLPRGRQADSFRQNVETEEAIVENKRSKLETTVSNSIVSHLRNLKYGSPKVGNVTSKLEYTEDGFTGEIVIGASVETKSGLKVISFPVDIQSDKVNLPNKQVVAEAVAKGTDVRKQLESEIAQEILDKMADVDELENWKEATTEASLDDAVDKKASLEKEAAEPGGIQYLGPQNTIKINKHMLSSPDMEIGEILYADGFHWKLTDKSGQQLSKGEDDGTLWTFTKVETEKEPKERLGN